MVEESAMYVVEMCSGLEWRCTVEHAYVVGVHEDLKIENVHSLT